MHFQFNTVMKNFSEMLWELLSFSTDFSRKVAEKARISHFQNQNKPSSHSDVEQL